MLKPRSIRLNLFAGWINHAVAIVIGVVLMPFVLHTLGDESYGTWIFINSLAGYSGLLYLGFGQTVSRYVATYHAQRDWDRVNQMVNGVLVVYLCMGALALLIAGVLAWLAPRFYDWGGQSLLEVRLVIGLLGVNVAVGLAGSVFGGVLIGLQRFDLERGVSLVSGIVRLVLTLAFLQAEWGLLTVAGIFLIVTLLENIGTFVFAFRQLSTLSIGRRHLCWSTLRESCSFSAFAFLDALSGRLIEATDTILIGLVFNARLIVPYYVALRLSQFVSRPVQQIGCVFMPRAGQLHAVKQNEMLRKLIVQGTGLAFLLAMGAFIGAAFFGRTVIEAWVGPEYSESHLLLLVLLGSRIVAIPVEVLRSVLFGIGDVRVPALVDFAEAVANLGLSLVLVHYWGLLGVAMGTAIPVIAIELGVLVPYALHKLRFNFGNLIREALGPQLPPLIALWVYSFAVATFLPPSADWWPLAAATMGGGLVLGFVWWCTTGDGRRLGFWKSVET